MEWFCTVLMTGVLLSIGWRLGELIYEWIKAFVTEAPDGIREIRMRRRRRRKNKKATYTDYYSTHGKRS